MDKQQLEAIRKRMPSYDRPGKSELLTPYGTAMQDATALLKAYDALAAEVAALRQSVLFEQDRIAAFLDERESLRARLAEVQEEADRRTREVEACYTVQRDLKARLAHAEACLAEKHLRLAKLEKALDGVKPFVDKVVARLAEAEAALHIYGGHIPPCPGRPCYCGFQKAWESSSTNSLEVSSGLVVTPDQPSSSASDDSALKPGEEWWMDVAGVPVKLDEWEPGAKKRKADQPEAADK